MAISYFIAPSFLWQFTQNDGIYNVKGKLYTYRATAKDEPKAVYQDAGGSIPYPNPIILDGVGRIPIIYWADDELYYVRLTDENDQLIEEADNYPIVSSGGGHIITTEVDYDNELINGQFRFYNAKKLTNFQGTTEYSIAAGWFFYKDNSTAGDEAVSFIEFSPGSPGAVIEGNPKYYLNYTCGLPGTGESVKEFYQKIPDVRYFSGKNIVFSIVGKSTTSSTIEIYAIQNFGTGGAPSAEVRNLVGSVTLTALWNKSSFTYVVPNISGKNLGINNDDYISFAISVPKDALVAVNFVNAQINFGDKVLEYQSKQPYYETHDALNPLTRSGYWEPIGLPKKYEDVRYLSLMRTGIRENWNVTNSFELMATPPIGSILIWPTEVIPNDYWLCNGYSKFKSESPRLYDVLGNRYTSLTANSNNCKATVLTNTVTVTITNNGTCTDAVDVDTGFVITVTQHGDATHPEIFTVACGAASTLLKSGKYFNFNTQNGTAYSLMYIIDNDYLVQLTVAGRQVTYVYLNSTDTADIVATKTMDMLNPLRFNVPNLQSMFVRGTSNGDTRDPDRASRTARADGTGGDHVGTTQTDGFKSHQHTYTGTPSWTGTAEGGNQWYPQSATQTPTTNTGLTGGNETRPINIGMNYIIKY